MRVNLVKHPLALHKLRILRNKETDYVNFRRVMKEISFILAVESTRDLPSKEVEVETPLGVAKTKVISADVLVVPILRAGLGMLEGFLELIPEAKVGFIGIYRDEESLQPRKYYYNIPRHVREDVIAFLLDPMIATGGSIRAALDLLKRSGIKRIKVISLIAYRDTVEKLASEYDDLSLDFYSLAIDEVLNERGFIVPGLGDAGDRTFGTY